MVNSQNVNTRASQDTATLGGGCFWCLEAIYDQIKGVKEASSGFAGGTVKNPTYKEVCTGLTGHAEVVQVIFDPSVISYDQLLEVYFAIHDATTLNRQGEDVGTQYRSVVFYHNEAQKLSAERMIQKLTAEKAYPAPIVTEIKKLDAFYPAEDYHRDYYVNHTSQPYCSLVISPKVEKFKKKYKNLIE